MCQEFQANPFTREQTEGMLRRQLLYRNKDLESHLITERCEPWGARIATLRAVWIPEGYHGSVPGRRLWWQLCHEKSRG